MNLLTTHSGVARITNVGGDNSTSNIMCTVYAENSSIHNSMYFKYEEDYIGTLLLNDNIGASSTVDIDCGRCTTLMISRNATDNFFSVTALLTGKCFCDNNSVLECQGHLPYEVDHINVTTNGIGLGLQTPTNGADVEARYVYGDTAVYENCLC